MIDSLFTSKVKSVVRNIPSGSTMSYSAVARAAGYPRAHRAVAGVMSKNFEADIPCHRVIKSNGTLGGYNRGGTNQKRSLLLNEGAIIS